MKLSLTFCED